MAPPNWLCLSKLLSATKKGGCHVSRGVLAATAALVLGLRFSVVALVLLGLATVINFATGVLGGSGPLVVGSQMLATLASVQISYLVAACLQRIFPCEPSYLSTACDALRCIQATLSGKLESCSCGHCVIIFDPKDQLVGRLAQHTLRSDGAMNPRQVAITATALFGTVILVGGVIAAVTGLEMREASVSNADAVSAATAVTAITEAALPDGSQRSAAETVPAQVAAVSASDRRAPRRQ